MNHQCMAMALGAHPMDFQAWRIVSGPSCIDRTEWWLSVASMVHDLQFYTIANGVKLRQWKTNAGAYRAFILAGLLVGQSATSN